MQHNAGMGSFTRKYKPWVLLYKESYKCEKDALDREKFFKTKKGRSKLKEMFNNCPVV